MPSVKLPRKSTDTDMTPFVDIAFLILSFFIMATKFKAPEPVKITTPNSVSSDILKENNALTITISPDNRVFVNVSAVNDQSGEKVGNFIRQLSADRQLGLTDAQVESFKKATTIGVPFSQLKGFLDLSQSQQASLQQPGIPVSDSLNNELVWWVGAAKSTFSGSKLLFLIKGDNNSKYPTFEAVVDALKRNEEFKYDLITSREEAPAGTELYKERNRNK